LGQEVVLQARFLAQTPGFSLTARVGNARS
jgi:hypothetical protein